MKILLLCPHIDLSEHTAPAIHVCEICKNLTKLGNKIFLVSSTTDGHLPPLKNIKHYSIKTKATGIGRWLICEVLGFLLGAKVILKEKIDLVYERHYPTAIGVLLAKMFGKASVVEVNGLVADEARLSKGFLKRIIGRLGDFEFVLSGRADRIISVTPKIRDVMVGEAGIR
ncbi:MAG: glycosyltransferase, partial [Candidatus Micrarchaeia archaeon]